MIEIVGAFLLGGVTGAVAKDKILGSAQKENSKQNELDSLYAENQKFSKEAQYKGANYQDIDCFITDRVLTPKQQAYFEDQTEIIFEEETI